MDSYDAPGCLYPAICDVGDEQHGCNIVALSIPLQVSLDQLQVKEKMYNH